jgi:hypothetical protein
MNELITKMGGAMGELFKKEALVNPLLSLAISFLSSLLTVASNSVEGEEGKKFVRVGARTILNMEWKLRESVNASPSQWDDKILDEFIESCKEIEPGYVAVS